MTANCLVRKWLICWGCRMKLVVRASGLFIVPTRQTRVTDFVGFLVSLSLLVGALHYRYVDRSSIIEIWAGIFSGWVCGCEC
uniref:Uncharacterized protein n=1 Tax=Utricularia reniformis TaxID=192314 RepID=A0A1Y0B2S0_9LAMI|nr:hypothetical protein AEK19_MT1496 [Utricularia reniformis]ART31687.1 hypothetical protein AEK19_MT1496 [Utricularia reniformis]